MKPITLAFALVVLLGWPGPAVAQTSELQIRKVMVTVEEIRIEGGKELVTPMRRATALAVIANPYAGRYVEDLNPLFALGATLGELFGTRAVEALGVSLEEVRGYGKAGLVGTDGEVEHLAAILHPQMGRPFREAVGGGQAIIPSTAKRGAPGATLDVPIHNKDDEWIFSDIDTIEVRVPDGPAPDEIVIVLAVTAGSRPLARISDARVP